MGGKFFNVQRPSQKTIDKQIALLKNTSKAQIASTNTTQSDTVSSAELTAAQKEAERLSLSIALCRDDPFFRTHWYRYLSRRVSADTGISLHLAR